MFVIPSDFESESAKLAAYAREHSMLVVMANFGGPSGGLTSAGRSAIWSEQGELQSQLGPTGAGLVVAAKTESGWRSGTVALASR